MFSIYVAMYGFTGPPALNVNIMKNIEIVVHWDLVDDFLPTTYTVTWTDDRELFEVATVQEETSHTITGLTLDTVYTIRVGAANTCGSGPEITTSVSLSTDTTSTTSSISPTVTDSTNPMSIVSTVNPSSSSNPSTTTMVNPTTNSMTTTVNENADISASRNPDTTMTTTTTTTNPSITSGTNIIIVVSSTNIANTPTTDETSKFSTCVVNMHTVYHNDYLDSLYSIYVACIH